MQMSKAINNNTEFRRQTWCDIAWENEEGVIYRDRKIFNKDEWDLILHQVHFILNFNLRCFTYFVYLKKFFQSIVHTIDTWGFFERKGLCDSASVPLWERQSEL